MDKRKISATEAVDLIVDGDNIHTFRNTRGLLLGCDIPRNSIIELINAFEPTLELTGTTARSMKHGLCLIDSTGPLFIQTDEERLNVFDPIKID